ncbi:MAG: hypothetical protein OEQ39_20210 [Gammaproteobacteria bacterium]|nr:hypothetical protein [Gammaproteobacteria bacterium]
MIAKISENRVNWRQAFVEVTLIGTGVLIALAVDSWWDEKQERAAEVQYLRSLQTDFQTNQDQLRTRIEVEQRMIDLGKRLHEFVESDHAEFSLSELNALVNGFYTLNSWMPITGTYEEMLGSGRLLYIRNSELRKKLSQYAHLLIRARNVENNSWTNWYFEQSPYLRQHLNMSQFGWIGDYFSDPPFDVDMQVLRSREFHNLVSSWMVARQDITIDYRRIIAAGDEVLDLIGLELDSQ